MIDTQHTSLADIANHFDTLEDPRSSINRRHPLTSVVVIAIMAILAGANGPTAIAQWARAKQAFLCQGLHLPFGVPCKDVFRVRGNTPAGQQSQRIPLARQPEQLQHPAVSYVGSNPVPAIDNVDHRYATQPARFRFLGIRCLIARLIGFTSGDGLDVELNLVLGETCPDIRGCGLHKSELPKPSGLVVLSVAQTFPCLIDQ